MGVQASAINVRQRQVLREVAPVIALNQTIRCHLCHGPPPVGLEFSAALGGSSLRAIVAILRDVSVCPGQQRSTPVQLFRRGIVDIVGGALGQMIQIFCEVVCDVLSRRFASRTFLDQKAPSAKHVADEIEQRRGFTMHVPTVADKQAYAVLITFAERTDLKLSETAWQ